MNFVVLMMVVVDDLLDVEYHSKCGRLLRSTTQRTVATSTFASEQHFRALETWKRWRCSEGKE